MHALTRLALVTALFAAIGCAGPPKASVPPGERQQRLNHGYALLYKFVNDNSQVDKILLLKSVSEPTDPLIREIAKVCSEAVTQLDAFAKQDPTLGYDQTGLPPMETATRERIASDKTQTLLGSSGRAFELSLLLAQAEGTNYGAALTQTLAEYERDADRRAWLDETGTRLSSLHQQVVERLTIQNP